MLTDRLPLAVDAGALPEAAARIVVFGPVAGQDLSALGKDRVTVVQGFKPDHDWFDASGYTTVIVPDGLFDAAVVSVPRAKASARARMAQALDLTGGGPVLVDGQKEDGVESLLKDCRKVCSVGDVISKAHGKIFSVSGTAPDDWRLDASLHEVEGGFFTTAGVFSADGIDPASRLLAETLPAKLPRRMIDLGAGWGYLSRAVLEKDGVEALHLVEADHAALACARQNITDPRAEFHWADATRFGTQASVDGVVCNPPFHKGRAADPGIGRAFIASAARLLTPSGRLWMVANRHLPYEKAAAELFADVREIGGTSSFKVIEAAKPRRLRR